MGEEIGINNLDGIFNVPEAVAGCKLLGDDLVENEIPTPHEIKPPRHSTYKNMSKIISGYEFVYEKLSNGDREQLEADIAKVLNKNIASVQGGLAKEVEKAVTSLYNNLICNPWGDVIKDNSGPCEFINAITEHVWNLMLNQDPTKVSKYDFAKLIDAWREKHPQEFKDVIGADVATRLDDLQKKYEFEVSLNRNRY